MPKKGLVITGAAILVLLLVVLLGGGAYHVYRQNNPDPGGAMAATANLPPDKISPEDMAMGSANAPVTMIEYYAQSCSYCARFDQNVFPQIKVKYIDTGKLRYVMRLFPLFPVDGPAYKLTRCVAPEKYFQAVDLMFRNQPQWDSAEFQGVDAQAGLMKMARLLGMNDDQANKCMNSTARDAAINQTAQDADARYSIQGTPTIVINSKKIDMPHQSWQEAQAAIDAALGGAK
jgi:protein-disulfide isomerase